MEFQVDESMRETLDAIRVRGRKEMRPIGLDADRLGRPIPVDDPYFAKLIERGEGRTRWRGPESEKKGKSRGGKAGARKRGVTVMTLLLVEELASYLDFLLVSRQ